MADVNFVCKHRSPSWSGCNLHEIKHYNMIIFHSLTTPTSPLLACLPYTPPRQESGWTMESISPFMKNSSVRRLSLELVHKFATNLLTSSPVREGVLSPCTPRPCSSRRRASDVFDSTSSTSPTTLRPLLSLSPFAHQQPGHPTEYQKGEWVPFE